MSGGIYLPDKTSYDLVIAQEDGLMSKRYYQRDAEEHPDHCVGERTRAEIDEDYPAVVADVDAAGRAVSASDTEQRFRITSIEPVRVEFLAAALLVALEGTRPS